MKYVKTITSSNINEIEGGLYLLSPSIKKPQIPEQLTIIDCHTFYLRLFVKDTQVRFDHYMWLLSKLYLNLDSNHIVIMPDFHEFFNTHTIYKLTYLWTTFLENSKNDILAHPNNPLMNITPNTRVIGHYMYDTDILNNYVTHPDWTHIFSQIMPLNFPNSTLITYDSQYNIWNAPSAQIRDIHNVCKK